MLNFSGGKCSIIDEYLRKNPVKKTTSSRYPNLQSYLTQYHMIPGFGKQVSPPQSLLMYGAGFQPEFAINVPHHISLGLILVVISPWELEYQGMRCSILPLW